MDYLPRTCAETPGEGPAADGLALIAALTPGPPDYAAAWADIERSPLGVYVPAMAGTGQNPVYHGEGDVWTHTKNVCGELCASDHYRAQPEHIRALLFTAALLHDVGKVRATRWENGRWTSPNHSAIGAGMARELLWTRLGLYGTPEKQGFREAVCALVRRHAMPARGIDRRNAERRILTVSQMGLLAPDFTLERLCALSAADARGRICGDLPEMLACVELCVGIAREKGCLNGPYPFPDGHTRFAYLSGRDVPPDAALKDGRWGPVILLSGPSGAARDRWRRENLPGLPALSPEGGQGAAQEAARRARAYLQRRESFVWSAPCLTEEDRRQPLELFHASGAWVRLVYLESGPDAAARRDGFQTAPAPEASGALSVAALSPPAPGEAREVAWICL